MAPPEDPYDDVAAEIRRMLERISLLTSRGRGGAAAARSPSASPAPPSGIISSALAEAEAVMAELREEHGTLRSIMSQVKQGRARVKVSLAVMGQREDELDDVGDAIEKYAALIRDLRRTNSAAATPPAATITPTASQAPPPSAPPPLVDQSAGGTQNIDAAPPVASAFQREMLAADAARADEILGFGEVSHGVAPAPLTAARDDAAGLVLHDGALETDDEDYGAGLVSGGRTSVVLRTKRWFHRTAREAGARLTLRQQIGVAVFLCAVVIALFLAFLFAT